VVGAGSLVDRSGGDVDLGVPRRALLTLYVPAYDPANCPLCRQGEAVVKPGSRAARPYPNRSCDSVVVLVRRARSSPPFVVPPLGGPGSESGFRVRVQVQALACWLLTHGHFHNREARL